MPHRLSPVVRLVVTNHGKMENTRFVKCVSNTNEQIVSFKDGGTDATWTRAKQYEYYKGLIADIIADFGDDSTNARIFFEAFDEALEEWRSYHAKAESRYRSAVQMLKDYK